VNHYSTRRRFVMGSLLVILMTLVARGGHVTAQKQPSRLLVVNNTKSLVEVFALTRYGEQSRGRADPGAQMSVYNVSNGDRFRAVWRGGSREHAVQLSYSREYGGWQSVFPVP